MSGQVFDHPTLAGDVRPGMVFVYRPMEENNQFMVLPGGVHVPSGEVVTVVDVDQRSYWIDVKWLGSSVGMLTTPIEPWRSFAVYVGFEPLVRIA